MESSNPPSGWPAETSYREISNYHNNRMGITKSAMNELRTYINFTQLRFHCSKQQLRTFHVTTVTNSTGEAVVQYLSGQTDVLPFSCYSFKRLNRDNSQLAQHCEKWGNDGARYASKWGHHALKGEHMTYNYAAFVAKSITGLWLMENGSVMMSLLMPSYHRGISGKSMCDKM